RRARFSRCGGISGATSEETAPILPALAGGRVATVPIETPPRVAPPPVPPPPPPPHKPPLKPDRSREAPPPLALAIPQASAPRTESVSLESLPLRAQCAAPAYAAW